MYKDSKRECLTEVNFNFDDSDEKLQLPISINDAININKDMCLKYMQFIHRKNFLNTNLRTHYT